MKKLSFKRFCYLNFYMYLIVFLSLHLFNNILVILRTGYDVNLRTYRKLKITFPLILFAAMKIGGFNVKFKKWYHFVVCSAIFLVFIVPTQKLLGWHWNELVIVEYLLFSMAYFELLTWKISNDLEAFSLTLFLLIISGVIYEIPLNPTYGAFINVNHPFKIHSAWIMFAFAFSELNFQSTLNSHITLLAVTLLVTFLVISHFLWVHPILIRLPTLTFWLAPLYEAKP